MESSVNIVIIGAARARADQIRAELVDLENRRLALESEVKEIDNAIAVAEREQDDAPDVESCGCSSRRPAGLGGRGRRVRYMKMRSEPDYSGTADQTEQVIRIAEATADGVVNATHVAEIMLEANLSSSRKDYLRGRVQNILSKHDDFEKVAAGTYRYLDWQEDDNAGA